MNRLSYPFFKVVVLYGLMYQLSQRFWPGLIFAGIYLVLYYKEHAENK